MPQCSGEPPGLLLVHRIIAKSGSARSISGPCVIRTRAAFFVVGLTWAAAGVEWSRLPTVTTMASFRSSLYIDILQTDTSNSSTGWPDWGQVRRRRQPLRKAEGRESESGA